MVFSWIINALSKDIACSKIYFDKANEIWMDLKVRFIQRNGPRLLELKKALACHTQGSWRVLYQVEIPMGGIGELQSTPFLSMWCNDEGS